MIDKATVEKIKEAADIVEVVSDYVHLVRRGANFMGLCPFHNERTPSFSVNRSKNMCYCFSCHKGGSPVNFIMEKEGISYHDALLQLAKKYGIKVEERELTDAEREAQTKREGMYIANEWAMKFMQQSLLETEEGRNIGLQYLYSRGITEEAIRKFALGYVPDSGFAITEAARKKGFDLELLHELGLLGKSEKGRYYDRFRGRVMFPILNSSGKAVAFGGRDLKGGPAKYINSPESELYKKSNELYGIYQARQAMVKEDRCYLVEGYLDVIGMWQSGVQNVVASSGTALTDGQIALIHRFTANVTLIYDGDAAGIKAALRGINMLLSHQLDVNVLLLPDGHDPDSFARANTPEQFRQYIKEHQTDIIRFKTQVLLADAGNDLQKRSLAVHSIVDTIAWIPDKLKRDIYIRECSRLLQVSEQAVAEATARSREKVVAEMRRRRLNQRPLSQPAAPQAAAAAAPAHTPSVAMESLPLFPLEKKVMEYCIRYGFMDFCEVLDDNGVKHIISVAEFVDDELKADDIDFSVPQYQRIFRLILSWIPEFHQQLKLKSQEVDNEIATLRQEGYNEIAAKDLSVAQIQKEEERLNQRLSDITLMRMKEFCKEFGSRRLLSHEDDEIRAIATTAVRERHQLSQIYSREHPVEKEEDKLLIYLPRALTELKSGILNGMIQEVMNKLRAISGQGDTTQERELQLQLTNMMRIRAEVAKNIGERIICPRRRTR